MSNEQLCWPLRSCPWPLHQHTSRPQTHTQWFPSYGPLGTLCSAVIIWLRASLPILIPKTPSSIKTKVACCFSSGPTFLPCTQSKSPINVFISPSGWMNEQGMCRGVEGGRFDLNGKSILENREKLRFVWCKEGEAQKKALRPGTPGSVESLFHS